MRNIRLTISYDGTNYCGWQVQPNGVTIQEVIEGAIQKMTDEKVSLIASGRTDAGVHAIAQVAAFKTTNENISCEGFLKGINSLIPEDVRIVDAVIEDDSFHAKRNSVSKTYKYLILNGPLEAPLLRSRYWLVRAELDVSEMREAALCLVGVHDFSAFCASDDCNEGRVREVLNVDIKVEISKDHSFLIPLDMKVVTIDIKGRGFLKNMVRNIVGTLVDVGMKRTSPYKFREILESKDRTKAGVCAPASGLYLLSVDY